MIDGWVFVIAGALVGGLVSGLTGFGTGVAALPLWLQVMAPIPAAQLVAACSVVGQLATIRKILHAIDFRRAGPMVLAGFVGVPIGTWLVPMIDVAVFKRGVGILVISYCAVMFMARGARTRDFEATRAIEIAIGFLGGILSGLAGLSGVLPTMWAVLQGWSKERSRALFQAYNLPVLAVTFLAHAAQLGIAAPVLWAFLAALPATFLGVALGQQLYRRASDARFELIVLAMLLMSGLTLLLARN